MPKATFEVGVWTPVKKEDVNGMEEKGHQSSSNHLSRMLFDLKLEENEVASKA